MSYGTSHMVLKGAELKGPRICGELTVSKLENVLILNTEIYTKKAEAEIKIEGEGEKVNQDPKPQILGGLENVEKLASETVHAKSSKRSSLCLLSFSAKKLNAPQLLLLCAPIDDLGVPKKEVARRTN